MGVAKEKMKLSSYASLFGNTTENGENVTYIDLDELHSFKNHPFKVLENDDMVELISSIKQNGVINPIIVRTTNNGYEIIAAHSRTHASKAAGLKTIPAIVKDNISDDEAIIQMVDSNLSRETILPSEKAFSYRMKYEALKHQGKTGKNTNDEIGTATGDSGKQVYRYIRLTNLIPQILEFVDDNKIKLIPAVDISYLDTKSQKILYQYIDDMEKFPSVKQAKEIKEYYNANKAINSNVIASIMESKKSKAKSNLPKEFTKYFDNDMSDDDIKNEIVKILENHFFSGDKK